MPVYEECSFPNGLRFKTRPGTSDYNTVRACGFEDEYETDSIPMEDKLVFDIGAHIGGWGIRAAQRGAIVVAVEAIPENAKMIAENAELNGLDVRVLNRALGDPPQLLLRYNWNGTGPDRKPWEEEVAKAHAFIGNTGLGNEGFPADTEVWIDTVTLSKLVEEYGVPDIIKTDCEGGEWQLFNDPARFHVPLIIGEWHDMAKRYREEGGTWVETESGYRREDVARLLEATHHVTFSGLDNGAGAFRAELRR